MEEILRHLIRIPKSTVITMVGALYGGFPKIRGPRGPYKKDYLISGSLLGSPSFGKLPCRADFPHAKKQV